jgi:hypothetical protein
MRITVTSVFVDDQENALRFNTDVLGCSKVVASEVDGRGPR